MNDRDKKIVKRGIQRQYFPNDAGNFNMDELKKRKVGIKKIEHQYIDRVKSAHSPARKGYQTGVKAEKITTKNINVGLFKQNLSTITPLKNQTNKIGMINADSREEISRSELNSQTLNPDSQRDYNGSMLSKTTTSKQGLNKKSRRMTTQRPIQNLIDKYGAEEEEEKEEENAAKLKFPLLKGDDDLDNLLNEMLGPEVAKKLMYGSDHASHVHD